MKTEQTRVIRFNFNILFNIKYIKQVVISKVLRYKDVYTALYIPYRGIHEQIFSKQYKVDN